MSRTSLDGIDMMHINFSNIKPTIMLPLLILGVVVWQGLTDTKKNIMI